MRYNQDNFDFKSKIISVTHCKYYACGNKCNRKTKRGATANNLQFPTSFSSKLCLFSLKLSYKRNGKF